MIHRAAAIVVAGFFVTTGGGAHAQSVETLWKNHCASCHADNGKGGGAGTQSLLDDEWATDGGDRALYDAIRKGLPDTAMPGYEETLDEKQTWGLVVHVRELRSREARRKSGSPKAAGGVYTSRHLKYRIETVVARDLDTPWSVGFLPDGSALVTERGGPVRPLVDGKLGPAIKGTPDVWARGQGGMMDVAYHPDHAKNGWVYLSYSHPRGTNTAMTKVVRGRIKDGAWSDEQVIFEAQAAHYSGSGVHFGCRLVFTPADEKGRRMLYFAIGERGSMEHAQNLDRPNGKVYRVWDDGTVPEDNPFASRKAYPQVWSYGHRNPQGLVLDLEGNLWDTEHGPRGGDELNLVQKGRNYGWPEVSFGINYSDAPFKTPWSATGKAKDGAEIAMPVFHWTPSIGACGLDVARGPALAAWKGDLFAGGLSGANVDRIRIRDGKMVEREEIIHGMGRIRDVVCAPDGTIWVVTNGPDKVLRIVEAK